MTSHPKTPGVTASWDSAVQSPGGYAVPRRFMWFLDAMVLAFADLASNLAAPTMQMLAGPDGILRAPAFDWLALPDAHTMGAFRPMGDLMWIPLVMAPCTLLFMQMLGGYRPVLAQSRTRLLVSSLGAPLFGLSAVALLATSLKIERTSRVFMYSSMLLAAVGFLGCRLLIRAHKRRRLAAGAYAKNIVIAAPPAVLQAVSDHFAPAVAAGLYRLRGFLSTPTPADAGVSSPGSPLPGVPYIGDVGQLGDLLVHRPIHEVVAVTSPTANDWLPQIIEHCDYFQVALRIVPEELLLWQQRDAGVSLRTSSLLSLPEIVLRPRNFDNDALFAKRMFDIALSSVLLLALSPLLVLIAVAIKITTPRLPVFYPWKVVGYKGRLFTGYKFTTMHADADDRKADLQHLNEMTGPVFKIKDDPRITPLGRFLRRFSLNELPQLWSVFKGDMSMVGPRPAYPNELARYELWHKRKLCVQPGVTCLWQIRGRNKISSFDDWVRMDFEYIDNWSLWLDCVIVARTAWAVVAGTGS